MIRLAIFKNLHTKKNMMRRLSLIAIVITIVSIITSSCGSNRCGGKRDCNGVKKTYNKSGGFWM
jgi:hypothetical protein